MAVKNLKLNFADKASTSRSLRGLGIVPKFAGSDEVKAVQRLAKTTSNFLQINSGSLFSIFPEVNFEPIDKLYQTRSSDNTGFLRLKAHEFVIRPNIMNVTSCHSLLVEGNHNPGGNFNYLANPNWACYAFYRSSNSESQLGHAFPGILRSDYKGLPNLIATVNVCFGYVGRNPSVMLSRIYGDSSVDISKLVEYFTYNLGLEVYVSAPWKSSNAYRSLGVDNTNRANNLTFVTVPMVGQVVYKHQRGTPKLVSRYGDIEASRIIKAERSLLVAEKQPVVGIPKPTNRAAGAQLASVITESDVEFLEYFVRNKMSVETCYTPNIRNKTCAGCGLHIYADRDSCTEYIPGHGLFCSSRCEAKYRADNKVQVALNSNDNNNLVVSEFELLDDRQEAPREIPVANPPYVNAGTNITRPAAGRFATNGASFTGTLGQLLEQDLVSLEELVGIFNA